MLNTGVVNNMDEHRYDVNEIEISWREEDSLQYNQVNKGTDDLVYPEELPLCIILDEKEEGYTWKELEQEVSRESFYWGYEIIEWNI